ncbi:MAG: LarC family nickel insertion protein, partial [Bacteroidales bacterium]|nr:LarC family nickel insertion protein [Bacteroidales bacterium]
MLKKLNVMKILYYDCFSGISGDMNLGAMLDLGVSRDELLSGLQKLNISGWRLDIKPDQRHGISGTMVTVITDEPAVSPDDHDHGHDHDHNHGHGADHRHDHGHKHQQPQ